MRDLLDADVRDRVGTESPRLLTDTLMLTGSALVPFALTALVIADARR